MWKIKIESKKRLTIYSFRSFRNRNIRKPKNQTKVRKKYKFGDTQFVDAFDCFCFSNYFLNDTFAIFVAPIFFIRFC